METPLLWKILFGENIASLEDLRKMLMTQIVIFTTLNGISAIVSLTTKELSYAESSAVVVSLILLWTCVPFGGYGAWKENGGMLSFFVVYGILSGAARTVLRIVAAVMVASSCQMEQTSFMGCYLAQGDGLDCLTNSTCSKSQIGDWNHHVAEVRELPYCKAWGVNDCSNAPDTQTSLGFNGMKIFYLIVDVATACVPVYLAFIYLIRLEAVRAAETAHEGDELYLNEVERGRFSSRHSMKASMRASLTAKGETELDDESEDKVDQ